MGMYLNPGNGMFQRMLDGRFYVDKTGMASFMNGRMGTAEALVCVSRPRRFGESVDADMLVAAGDGALAQIRGRNYPAALRDLSGECVLAGVTYDADTKRHGCAIERIEL